MSETREKLFEELNNKVIGLNWLDGTYIYHLTRAKSAFEVGTMTFDDFVEVDEELIDEILGVVMPIIDKLQKENAQLKLKRKSKFDNMTDENWKDTNRLTNENQD